jgi:uncharacterized protein (DUF983 family)
MSSALPSEEMGRFRRFLEDSWPGKLGEQWESAWRPNLSNAKIDPTIGIEILEKLWRESEGHRPRWSQFIAAYRQRSGAGSQTKAACPHCTSGFIVIPLWITPDENGSLVAIDSQNLAPHDEGSVMVHPSAAEHYRAVRRDFAYSCPRCRKGKTLKAFLSKFGPKWIAFDPATPVMNDAVARSVAPFVPQEGYYADV